MNRPPAPPRYITPRTSRFTYGGRIAALAEHTGKPLLPWQRLAADLLTECDDTGRLIHPFGLVTVQRQSGKTTLMTPLMLHRGLRREMQRVWLTAQTGQLARELLLEQVDQLGQSPLYALLQVTRASANTSIRIPANGSRIKAHPPTHDSLHGMQSDLNVIDEAWSYAPEMADALMSAITPTQATRPDPQTIVASTVGTADSTWFHDLIDRGRAGEFPLVDYGVPDGTDPDDLDTICRYHPAVGFTQTRASIEAARLTLSPAGFLRAYGNLATARLSPLWTPATLDALTTDTPIPDGARLGWGIAADTGAAGSVVIVCAAVLPGGAVLAEFVDMLTHDAAPARVVQLAHTHGGRIAVDVSGPSLPVGDALARLPHTDGLIRRLGALETSSAAMEVTRRVRDGQLSVRAHPVMRAGLESAATRRIGDRITWARTPPAGADVAASIAPVEALGSAVRAALDTPVNVAPATEFR